LQQKVPKLKNNNFSSKKGRISEKNCFTLGPL